MLTHVSYKQRHEQQPFEPVSVLLALQGNLLGAVHDMLCLADARRCPVTCQSWSWLQGSLGSSTVLLDWMWCWRSRGSALCWVSNGAALPCCQIHMMHPSKALVLMYNEAVLDLLCFSTLLKMNEHACPSRLSNVHAGSHLCQVQSVPLKCFLLTQCCAPHGALIFCRPGHSPRQPAPADPARAHQPGCWDSCRRRSRDAHKHASGVGQQQCQDASRSHVQRAADLLWVSRAGCHDRLVAGDGGVMCPHNALRDRCAACDSCACSHQRRTGNTRQDCQLMCLTPVHRVQHAL